MREHGVQGLAQNIPARCVDQAQSGSEELSEQPASIGLVGFLVVCRLLVECLDVFRLCYDSFPLVSTYLEKQRSRQMTDRSLQTYTSGILAAHMRYVLPYFSPHSQLFAFAERNLSIICPLGNVYAGPGMDRFRSVAGIR